MQGKLIVIEGIDAAGSETQSNLLLSYLQKKKISSVRILYPDYEKPIGKLIHEYLHKKYELSPEMQFILYAGDIVKDQEKIRSWLSEGKIIIADRYFTSTLAYQGLQGIELDKMLKFAELFSIRKPDMIIYLDISPDTSMKRKYKEKNNLDRNEGDKQFLGRIRNFYKKLIEKNIFGDWFVIDGEKTKEEVFEQIKKILKI